MTKITSVLLLALVTVSGLSAEAQAGFIGAYDPANWTTTLLGTPPGGGSTISTVGAPGSIQILGGNGGCTSGPDTCLITFTVPAAGSGIVSFHWAYLSSDSDGASFEDFGRVLGGTLTQLSEDVGPLSQSGNVSFAVLAGQQFGFFLDCTDCIFGPANITLSEFSAPDLAATPEPGTLLLVGASLTGTIAALRRRRK